MRLFTPLVAAGGLFAVASGGPAIGAAAAFAGPGAAGHRYTHGNAAGTIANAAGVRHAGGSLTAIPGSWSPGPPGTPRYRFVSLGFLSARGSSAANDINKRGLIAGGATAGTCQVSHPALWHGGPPAVDLGTLSHALCSEGSAFGVNASGDVVGFSNVPDPREPPHAMLFTGGKLHDLGTGYGRGSYSHASDISDAGVIVGFRSRSQSSTLRAFRYRNGTFTDLGTLGGHDPVRYGVDAQAYAVNAAGQIVGAARPPRPPLHAFLWQQGVMRDLGTLPGAGQEGSSALDINAAGTVVGSSATFGKRAHAVAWRAGRITDLGALGGKNSQADGINRNGQIVGQAQTATAPVGNAGHATLWQHGSIIDLNTVTTHLPARVLLENATAINDSGWIVGFTCTNACPPGKTAPMQGFVLIPV